jgi:pyruvate dehydrogenase E2 component (dihydrolipoamide acetyltransferase)
MDFRLPDLGEGIDSATVTTVHVKPGDAVTEGQPLLEVETDKASVPIPAPSTGKLTDLKVKKGDKIKVGAVVAVFAGAGAPVAAAAPAPAAAPAAAPAKTAPAPAAAAPAPAPAAAPAAPAAPAGKVEFRLPPLGEGIDAATVTGVLVNAGDAVAADQGLFEVETDKAAVPIPAPSAGKVVELRIKKGDKVKVGAVVAVLESATGATAPSPSAAPAAAPAATAASAPAGTATASLAAVHGGRPGAEAAAPKSATNGDAAPAPAGPATRHLARKMGIDLHTVKGSGRGGRVTLDDLMEYVRNMPKGGAGGSASAAPVGAAVAGSFVIPPLPDFSKYGPVERKPFTGLRKTIARNLTISWNVAPAVTQHDLADITDLEAGRKRFVETAPKDTPKVTMTALAVKAVVAALKAFPHFNASYDANAGENGDLVLKKYYHVGIAVDTPKGLVVPVIRDADKKTTVELAAEINSLADKARAGKLSIEEMRGGTFTITNLGGIGGTYFSPIINYPEVAILGLSRSSTQPVWKDGAFVPRLMMPLSLSYDHRVIDGADGARFIAFLSAAFADPVRLLMY